jgi:hypothetical protein
MYFAKYNISYEIADFQKKYDSVYVSISGDLNKWAQYKDSMSLVGHSPRVIFDLSDLYLVDSPLRDRLRAIYNYFSGRTKTFRSSYRKTMMNMIEASDVVICGSLEQREMLLPLHSNVIVMRDYYVNDIRTRKSVWKLVKTGEIHILWEGFSHGGISYFRMLSDILSCLKCCDVHVHIVTDPTYCRIGGKHFCNASYDVIAPLFLKSNVNFHLYDWNQTTFSHIASACDLAIIPIPDDPVARMKPENKLLLLWSVGLPVIVSDTPSYSRVMNAVGKKELVCAKPSDWLSAISQLTSSESYRVGYMLCAQKYIDEYCSDQALLKSWDLIFAELC